MPNHRGRSSTGRNTQAGARTRAGDGVLVLYAEEGEPSPRFAPKNPMPEDDTLALLRAERDAALEEIAYLQEELRSVRAYHSHLLDEERRRMFDERTQLTAELVTMRAELNRRTFPGATGAWSPGGPRSTTSDDGADTR